MAKWKKEKRAGERHRSSFGRTVRLLEMVQLLACSEGWTVRNLAMHFQVSRVQIYKDLKELGRAGLKIEKARSGYRLGSEVLPRSPDLTVEEVLSLLFPSELFSETEHTAQSKLLLVLPERLRGYVMNLLRRTNVDVGSTTERDRRFTSLQSAVGQQVRIEIDYYSFSSRKRTRRRVDPYGLVYRGHSWYLIGYCHLRGEVRKFRLTRIHNVRVLDEVFEYPRGFSLGEFLADTWKIFGGEKHEITLRFSPRIAPLIKESMKRPGRILLPLSNGGVLLHTAVRGLDEVAWWVVQFGDDVTVVDPPELRDKVIEIANGIVRANKEVFQAVVVAETRRRYRLPPPR